MDINFHTNLDNSYQVSEYLFSQKSKGLNSIFKFQDLYCVLILQPYLPLEGVGQVF